MRQKTIDLRTTLLALLAAITLAFAGIASTAPPAEAVTGSTTWYTSRATTVPSTWRLVVTRTLGDTWRLSVGQAATHAFRACPSSLGGKIRYTNPRGQTGTLDYGECLVPTLRGSYDVRSVG